MIKITKKNRQKGQALLIVILVSLVLLTIGFSVVQQNIDETRITKLEEDNKRALAAAEAGIESLLQSNNKSVTIGKNGVLPDLEGIEGKAVVSEISSNVIETPLMRKDESYTVYLIPENQINTNQKNNSIFSITNSLSSTCNLNPNHNFAVELTFLNSSSAGGQSTTRYYDCGNVISGNDQWNNTSAPASQILLLRIIAPNQTFPGVRLTLTRALGDNWPLQGKTITSSVTTSTGLVKTIQLFQSFQQIPGDFYMTKF